MSKIWEKKSSKINEVIESFTVGEDNLLDQNYFFKYDIRASSAHVDALEKAKVLTILEADLLKTELAKLKNKWQHHNVIIKVSDEDCHTYIEQHLISTLGDIGKKIHTGRSRNDQALTMVRLYMDDTLDIMSRGVDGLISVFSSLRNEYRNDLFIGYTHTQQAMPTTLGHYFDAYVEQLTDDLEYVKLIKKSISKNPLGSGAGYGSVVDLDRQLTTDIMGFESIQKNSLYCQNSRGKFELKYVHALSQVMLTLQKFATDMVLFTSREFGFFTPDDSITTGSSMMPQKKNLDVAELIRANHAMIAGIETQIQTLSHGLMSGYNRDMQLIKKSLIEAYNITKSSIDATVELANYIKPNHENIMASFKKDICAADLATKLSVDSGMPFRDAYKLVMEDDNFDIKDIQGLVLARKSLGSPGNF